MYFQLMYHRVNDLYHARLYSADGRDLMWTHSYRDPQTVINVCNEIKRGGIGITTPIREAIAY